MTTTINLNSAAVAFLGENTRVRVRTVDGVLQLRPTNRVLDTNLPEGETLRNLSFKRSGDKITGAVFSLKGADVEAGTKLEFVKSTYGWLAAAKVDAVAKGVAGGSVSVR